MYSKTKSKTTQVHKVHALGAFRENKNAKLAVQTAIREIYVPRKLELVYCKGGCTAMHDCGDGDPCG